MSDGIDVMVSKKEAIAEGVMHFEFRPASGERLPAFTAGSHIDIALPNGAIRQYSLCNAPQECDRYEIAVLLEPNGRGGSRSAHGDLKQGDEVRISAPRNHFALVPARHSILIAGGIGVTPLLSMAEQLTRSGASFKMHYCTRSVARTAFAQRIGVSAFASRVHFHHDDGDAGQRFDVRQVLNEPARDTHLYVCGPGGFMDHVIQAAQAAGWAEECIHFEYFAGAPADTSHDRAFEVMLAQTGCVVSVAADKTVVQALAAQGIDVPVSCEQGVCGTCVMRVLEGEPDHRDVYFSDAERAANDQFTPCCSRAKSYRLVIDF
ncbi:PDR/VanB family oxidoreductase [Pandoraea terrae]|nr:PDR/VanB family oxidoreductase [Pandoraea terrae]